MSVINNIKIKDRDIEKAIKEVEKIAEKGKDGNFEIRKKQITYNDLSTMKEGVRYIDQDSSDPSIKRIVHKIGNDLYVIPLTKLDKISTE